MAIDLLDPNVPLNIYESGSQYVTELYTGAGPYLYPYPVITGATVSGIAGAAGLAVGGMSVGAVAIPAMIALGLTYLGYRFVNSEAGERALAKLEQAFTEVPAKKDLISEADNGVTVDPKTWGILKSPIDINGVAPGVEPLSRWGISLYTLAAIRDAAERVGIITAPLTPEVISAYTPKTWAEFLPILEDKIAAVRPLWVSDWNDFKLSPAYSDFLSKITERGRTRFYFSVSFQYFNDAKTVSLEAIFTNYGPATPPPLSGNPRQGISGDVTGLFHCPMTSTAETTDSEIYLPNTTGMEDAFYEGGEGVALSWRNWGYSGKSESVGAYLFACVDIDRNIDPDILAGVEKAGDAAITIKPGESVDDFRERAGLTETWTATDILTDPITHEETEAQVLVPLSPVSIGTSVEELSELEQSDVWATSAPSTSVITHIIETLNPVIRAAKSPTAPTDPTNTGTTPIPVVPGGLAPSSGLFSVHEMSAEEMEDFGDWLWGSVFDPDYTLLDDLKKLWQDPFNAIISLHDIYITPEIGGSKTDVTLGRIDSGVDAYPVTNRFRSLAWAPLTIPEKYYNVYDYDYTQVSIYLPFIGIMGLDTADIIGKTVHLSAIVDVYTGALVYHIEIEDSNSGAKQLQYIYNGICSVQIPITGADYSGIVSGLLTTAAGAVGSLVTGGAGAIAGGAIMGATGAFSRGMNVKQSGSIGSNGGAMSPKTPFLLITHKTPYDAAVFNRFYGYPANKSMILGDCTGYTRVKSIHLEGIPATSGEIDEIDRILKRGFVV